MKPHEKLVRCYKMTFSCDQIIYVGVEMGQIGVGNIEWSVSSDKIEKNIIREYRE